VHEPSARAWGEGKPPQRRRRLGIRQSLAQKFLAALESDFEKHGASVIQTVREERALDYLKIVIGLLPDEVPADDPSLREVSDEMLAGLIREIQSIDAAMAERRGGGGDEEEAGGEA
jgi:hypothetical protein